MRTFCLRWFARFNTHVLNTFFDHFLPRASMDFRYGQHVATKDLTSAKTRYSFLYSKNTSFGKLSTVTDSSGNKIQFLRDYSNAVSSIENTQDHKSELKISGVGYLVKLSEKGRSEIEFDYDTNSGLLTSRSGVSTKLGCVFIWFDVFLICFNAFFICVISRTSHRRCLFLNLLISCLFLCIHLGRRNLHVPIRRIGSSHCCDFTQWRGSQS